MRPWFAAAFIIFAARVALAQDEPLETREFRVAHLVTGDEDRPSVALGLSYDGYGHAGSETTGGPIDADALVALLKRDVAPDSWKRRGAKLEMRDDRLIAVNGRAALDGVAAWLEGARARHSRRIAVDAALLLVPAERWGRVEAKDLRGVSQVLQASRLFARSGSRVHAQRIHQLSYIRDHDVQIGTSAVALDPIVDVLNTGTRIDLTMISDPAGTSALLEVRAETSAFEGMEDKTLRLLKHEPVLAAPGADLAPAVAKDWEVLVQLPRITLDQFRGQVVARAGETVVAFAASRADGVVALTLTPAFVNDAPAAPEPATRVYDVQAIISKVQDFSGPRAELTSPAAGGAGPLTGATFTLDEPREGYGQERLFDDVRALVEAPGLPLERSAVTSTGGGCLALRTGHAAAEKLLAEIFRRETRTVVSEAVLLAFEPGEKEAWAKKVPALAPGGAYASSDLMAPLFDEARKGTGVRRIGTLSLSGRMGQQVFGVSGRQRAYVQDFEPQVSTNSAQADPIIGVFITGLGFEARPELRDDAGSMKLSLRFWSLSGDVVDEKLPSSGLGPAQRVRLEGPRWETDVVCRPGHWTLAGLETRGEEDWALFVIVK